MNRLLDFTEVPASTSLLSLAGCQICCPHLSVEIQAEPESGCEILSTASPLTLHRIIETLEVTCSFYTFVLEVRKLNMERKRESGLLKVT